MAFFKKKKTITAGLSLDTGGFRYLALEKSGQEYKVLESVSGEVPQVDMASNNPFADSGAHLGFVFENIVKTTGGFKFPVDFALPVAESLLRVATLPNMSVEEARLAFAFEFENHFPFPENEAVFDLDEIEYPAREGASEKRFLVAAIRRELVDNVTKAANANGIRLSALEPQQIALERAATPDKPYENSCIYVYAGDARSVLILSWKGNGIFYRNISFGFDRILVAGGYESDAYKERALSCAREIRSSMQFALSQNRAFTANTMYLFGPGASSALCDVMKETMAIDSVAVVDPLKIHGVDVDENGDWDVALGLALR